MDANGDGEIDSQDAIFSELKVWVDADSDGVADEGELRGLNEAGIQSINVDHVNSNTTQNGNVLFGSGQFTKTDGSSAAMTDVWFEVATPIELDFTQVKNQLADMTDDKAETLKLNLQDVLANSQANGPLMILGDGADAVQIVNGGFAVAANTQLVNDQLFNAYDLNQDGLTDLLIQQTMSQVQLA